MSKCCETRAVGYGIMSCLPQPSYYKPSNGGIHVGRVTFPVEGTPLPQHRVKGRAGSTTDQGGGGVRKSIDCVWLCAMLDPRGGGDPGHTTIRRYILQYIYSRPNRNAAPARMPRGIARESNKAKGWWAARSHGNEVVVATQTAVICAFFQW